jgi:hypothetical protein
MFSNGCLEYHLQAGSFRLKAHLGFAQPFSVFSDNQRERSTKLHEITPTKFRVLGVISWIVLLWKLCSKTKKLDLGIKENAQRKKETQQTIR